MARTQIPVTHLTRASVAIGTSTRGDVANGMYFTNDGNTYLEITSQAGTVTACTVEIPALVDGIPNQNRTITSIPAGGTVLAGPWPTGYYNQSDGTSVYVDPQSVLISFRAFSLS